MTLPLAFILLLTLALLGWHLREPLWRRWRRARVARQAFPAAWREVLRRQVPLVRRLPADLQLRLKQHIQVFLAEKPFIGCAGLEVSEAMRVVIAAQACLLVLGRRPGAAIYPQLRQVLVYPGPFVVPSQRHEGVLVHEGRDVRLGESWVQGQVLLSWPDVLAGAQAGALPWRPDEVTASAPTGARMARHDPRRGGLLTAPTRQVERPPGGAPVSPGAIADERPPHNVVVHEFAHQLDQEKGVANGAPGLPSLRRRRRWAQVFEREFQALRRRAARGEHGLLDAYGALDPAEFFAVASEAFFMQPLRLAAEHAALYGELAAFFRIEPRSW